MKKQHKTYLLLVIVLLVWGIIGFQFVRAINPSTSTTESSARNEKFEPKKIKERDTFSIVADYRDPFLGTVRISEDRPKKTSKKPLEKEIPKKKIAYTGFVTDGSKNQRIYFVTIEGQQLMMDVNDIVHEVKLVKGTKSHIQVSYNGISETISLNQ